MKLTSPTGAVVEVTSPIDAVNLKARGYKLVEEPAKQPAKAKPAAAKPADK